MAANVVTAAIVRQDLLGEQGELDEVMEILSADAWEMNTPSPGWAIRDQIGHLAYFDDTAAQAIAAPDEFAASRDQLVVAMSSDQEVDKVTLGDARAMAPGELIAHWRTCRQRLADAADGLADDSRVEWYGPSMGSKSFLTARLMECWAHGQDIVDTLGVIRRPTDRLAHIAQLGFITRKWTYINRGLEVPAGDVRVELLAPSGDSWTYGPDDDGVESVVKGSALDFCLVTSQRRHLDDTQLIVEGDLGRDWLTKAQLFAGPPSDPPDPKTN